MPSTKKNTPGSTGPAARGRPARARRDPSITAHAVDGAIVSLTEPLLDCEDAAALLSVRTSWVRDAARLGQLPCLRVGRHLRFTRPMLEDWLAGQFERPYRNGHPGARAPISPRVKAPAFRGRTEAALLESLAAIPNRREIDRDGQ